MTTNSVKINEISAKNTAPFQDDTERFIVFVARSERILYSSSTYAGAERLAIIFANLTNFQMEVFDSLKEVCYFVDPFESSISCAY